MKNTKQPVYDRANLIDFKRPNMWMNTVKGSKTEHSQPPIREVLFGIAIMFGIFLIFWALGEMGVIVVSVRGDI